MSASITAPDPRFWDRIAPGYAKKPVADEVAYQATLARVRHYLRPSDRALEVGCGTGSTALELASSVAELHASDLSPGMIRIAEDKARARGIQNVQFATGTLDEPVLAPGSFDVVMAFNLFHLFPDIPAALARVRTLLAPGGHLLFKTPCIGEQGVFLRVVIPVLRAFGRAPFVNFVTEQSLLDDVSRAGFEILETGLYPKKSHSLFIAARKSK
jgi:ubiquinone/menaquinone biosynthesis C-methylase UbiE